jgi:hypothetical protein
LAWTVHLDGEEFEALDSERHFRLLCVSSIHTQCILLLTVACLQLGRRQCNLTSSKTMFGGYRSRIDRPGWLINVHRVAILLVILHDTSDEGVLVLIVGGLCASLTLDA